MSHVNVHSAYKEPQFCFGGVKESGFGLPETGAHKLVLTHIIPPLPNAVTERIFLLGMDDIYDGEIILAKDGMRLKLPMKK